MNTKISRRKFLDWFLGTTVGGFFLTVFYPVSRYLIPPEAEESTALTMTLPVKAQEVKPNSGQIFKFGSKPGIVVRTPQGDLRAFSAICTHLACVVQYRPALQHVWCACHNGHYDLNGKNIGGPPPRPLEPYEVNFRGEQVVISRGRSREGAASRA